MFNEGKKKLWLLKNERKKKTHISVKNVSTSTWRREKQDMTTMKKDKKKTTTNKRTTERIIEDWRRLTRPWFKCRQNAVFFLFFFLHHQELILIWIGLFRLIIFFISFIHQIRIFRIWLSDIKRKISLTNIFWLYFKSRCVEWVSVFPPIWRKKNLIFGDDGKKLETKRAIETVPVSSHKKTHTHRCYWLGQNLNLLNVTRVYNRYFHATVQNNCVMTESPHMYYFIRRNWHTIGTTWIAQFNLLFEYLLLQIYIYICWAGLFSCVCVCSFARLLFCSFSSRRKVCEFASVWIVCDIFADCYHHLHFSG